MFPSLSLAATSFNKQQLLNPEVPQIALAGRSNVGKSSLVNALAGRRQLAKTSSTPGKTRSINYYLIDAPSQAYLVDLPGYGYARCSQEERKKWALLLEYYLSSTQGLRALAVLLDSRLEPQKIDIELVHFAKAISLPVIPVLTKTDKPKRSELEKCIQGWEKILGKNTPFIHTSSSKKTGVEELWDVFLDVLGMKEQPVLE